MDDAGFKWVHETEGDFEGDETVETEGDLESDETVETVEGEGREPITNEPGLPGPSSCTSPGDWDWD